LYQERALSPSCNGWLIICENVGKQPLKGRALDSPENKKPSKLLFGGDRTRTEAARNDIAWRLRKVCSDLPEDEFQALVEKLLENRLRHGGS
jgi:hypothetical protein